ncbi:NADH-quinone oxidoreductase subunit NuoH [Helicobacter sp. MIT 00-7814]|uniref:NADH-quinone oxidoreductase subunit NuoH n=1 Tax=unclassified Helicobacter TaxID=2593540 RepID=UPI000E1ED7BE|nr:MULTISPECIES: NADH-quinone oxidoreductase subunit NuoH [unclassified Helicobacter]RDU53924.1 NADH-quinone oxidoreductase subunit NuoH [Helicobacter sp. MIT 00-7814]RDU57054.1 NADH-quinone oxidoreductase subunit NuoH [Helicobacter sp. MIT 99-10781]
MSYFIIETLIKILIVLLIFSALAGFGTYLERKILGFFQWRLGPHYVGPFGLLQVLADGIKLFAKEDIIPLKANRLIFMAAPTIAAVSAFVAMAAIPFFPEFELFGMTIRPIIADINVGILFVLSVSACGIYAPILAGLSSHSKYALLGGARAALQFLSFEMIMGLSLLAPLMLVGSLSLIDINAYQGSFSEWLVFKQPLAFVLFACAAFIELNRTPFDLLEHEAEIVAGYCTEYSGLKWGMFFIGEYASMIAMCFVFSLIFFGGFNDLGFIPGGIAILLKVVFFIFLFMWVRATFPHVRPDQLFKACWKVMLPLALLNVLITGIVLLL